MHDLTSGHCSWADARSVATDPEASFEVRSSPTVGPILRRIGLSIHGGFPPGVQRRVSEALGQLPQSLRLRLHRLIGSVRPDTSGPIQEYQTWIDQFEKPGTRTCGVLAGGVDKTPLISIIMPVFNPRPVYLRAAIQSVRDQFYPSWELCIADDASTDPEIIAILRDAAAQNHRIKLERRERNGHVCVASNAALNMANGDFIALMDHDDLLPPHALHEVASRIRERPDADILYSDEDHIDGDGNRTQPYFKPGWNPELMLGQNLISHLGVYRRALVAKVGGFRTGYEGSQDHDLALRVIAETRSDRIIHIPKILYHWRQGAPARTFSEAAAEQCVSRARQAVSGVVLGLYPDARVEAAPSVPNWLRVIYPIPTPRPLVSVILAPAGVCEVATRCIERLLNRTDYAELEILVPPELRLEVTDPRVRFVKPRPGLRSNVLAAEARGSLLLLLDPALTGLESGWLTEMVSHAVRSDIGAVGAKILDDTGAILHAGLAVGGSDIVFSPYEMQRRGHIGYFGHLRLTRNVTAVSGGCLMLRHETYSRAGGRDALGAMLADVDLCLKLEDLGLRNVWTPYAELCREEQASLRHEAGTRRDIDRMRQRWGNRLMHDRYWNPNLLPNSNGVSLAPGGMARVRDAA